LLPGGAGDGLGVGGEGKEDRPGIDKEPEHHSKSNVELAMLMVNLPEILLRTWNPINGCEPSGSTTERMS
jgi:hypothetical protein